MDKILRNTNIWDLHIHTPLGTPTKKNYGNASTEEFIDTIIDIYNKSNNKIGMIFILQIIIKLMLMRMSCLK